MRMQQRPGAAVRRPSPTYGESRPQQEPIRACTLGRTNRTHKECAKINSGKREARGDGMIAAITGRGLRPLAANGCARRKAGALLVVSAILSAVAVSAPAETLRVGKAGRDAFSFVPADVGARTGIFRQHGVDIEISSFGGDARLQQAMAADGIDVGLGSGPGLAFIVKGSPVKGIAAMAGPPLLFALVVRNDAAVATRR